MRELDKHSEERQEEREMKRRKFELEVDKKDDKLTGKWRSGDGK